MAQELMIELHAPSCGCRGGSWIAGPGRHGQAACPDGQDGLPNGALMLPLSQWRAMGRPKNTEDYARTLARLSAAVVAAAQEARHRQSA